MTPYVPPSRDALRAILREARVIAVVGFSPRPDRPSHRIARYLARVGYTVYPVNPAVSDDEGRPVYATLADVPQPIDIVDVFRRSEFLTGVVDDAIAVRAGAIWAQVGVYDDDAARLAADAGIPIVMDDCIMVTHRTLLP